MFVSISIHSPITGKRLAHKIVPFYKDMVRCEYTALAYFADGAGLSSVLVYFNNHKLTFAF